MFFRDKKAQKRTIQLVCLWLGGTSAVGAAACVPKSCDLTLSFALIKEGKALNDRLGDLFGAIRATIKETRVTNALLVHDTFELMRTRQRYRIRLRDALEQSKHAEDLMHIISAGGALHVLEAQLYVDKSSKTGRSSK